MATIDRTVRDARDYRIRLGIMRMLEAAIDRVDDPETLKEDIIEEKRALRAWTRDTGLRRHLVMLDGKSGYDGMMVRIELDGCESFDEAEEWFDACERREYVDRGYDCTGQTFTRWHRIKRFPSGRFVCYHSIGRDV